MMLPRTVTGFEMVFMAAIILKEVVWSKFHMNCGDLPREWNTDLVSLEKLASNSVFCFVMIDTPRLIDDCRELVSWMLGSGLALCYCLLVKTLQVAYGLMWFFILHVECFSSFAIGSVQWRLFFLQWWIHFFLFLIFQKTKLIVCIEWNSSLFALLICIEWRQLISFTWIGVVLSLNFSFRDICVKNVLYKTILNK